MGSEMKAQGLGWDEGRSGNVSAYMLLAVLLSYYGGGTPPAYDDRSLLTSATDAKNQPFIETR